MPNLLPLGVWGRVGPDVGPALEMVQGWATAVGTTVPTEVLEVWAASASGVPVLVWSRDASAPTGVAASYSGTTQAVTVTWTLPTPNKATSFEIKRADGSVAGTVDGALSTFVDVDPRALTGTYSVVGVINTTRSSSASSNSLSLANPPQSMAQTWDSVARGPSLSWAAPTYGRPDFYNVYRDGVFLIQVPGNQTGYTHASFPPSSTHLYAVTAVLTGTEGTAASVSVTRGSAFYTNLTWALVAGQDQFTWTLPAYGTPDSVDVQLNGSLLGTLAGNSTFYTHDHVPFGHYLFRAFFNGVGFFDHPMNLMS